MLYPKVAKQIRLQIETIDALYSDDKLALSGFHGFIFRNRTDSFLSAHNINRPGHRRNQPCLQHGGDGSGELEDREPALLPHFSVHTCGTRFAPDFAKVPTTSNYPAGHGARRLFHHNGHLHPHHPEEYAREGKGHWRESEADVKKGESAL